MTKCSMASFFVFVVCFIFPVLAANNRAEDILSENDNLFWVNFNRTDQNLAIFATTKKWLKKPFLIVEYVSFKNK